MWVPFHASRSSCSRSSSRSPQRTSTHFYKHTADIYNMQLSHLLDRYSIGSHPTDVRDIGVISSSRLPVDCDAGFPASLKTEGVASCSNSANQTKHEPAAHDVRGNEHRPEARRHCRARCDAMEERAELASVERDEEEVVPTNYDEIHDANLTDHATFHYCSNSTPLSFSQSCCFRRRRRSPLLETEEVRHRGTRRPSSRASTIL